MENLGALDGRFVLAWDSSTMSVHDPIRGIRSQDLQVSSDDIMYLRSELQN